VRAAGFSKIHVFSFSPRAGTPAAAFPDRVPAAVVADRRRRLLELEQELAAVYFRSLIGRRLDVLVEGADPQRPGWVRGTSCRYSPVAFEGYAPALVGRRAAVRAVALDGGVLIGRPEPLPEEPVRIPLALIPATAAPDLAPAGL
jgi:tRNA A37 methylthiotransferase MiaB